MRYFIFYTGWLVLFTGIIAMFGGEMQSIIWMTVGLLMIALTGPSDDELMRYRK